jgi:hypothetical protein
MIDNMKHWIAGLSLVLLFLTGCDTVTHSQLQIVAPRRERGAPPMVAAPASERAAVKQVLSEIAAKHRLEDRTVLSLVPDTICSYAQADVKYPISFKAWVAEGRILIDLFQRPPETGETQAYRKLREEMMAQLRERFGGRLQLVHKMNQVGGRQGTKP